MPEQKTKQFPNHMSETTHNLMRRHKLPSEKPRLSEEAQERLNGEFLGAVYRNGLDEAKRLLDEGADKEAMTMATERLVSKTALMIAAINGNEKVCDLLIEKGANIDAKDSEGDTALTWAIREGRASICALLIRKGADVNARNRGYAQIMHAAVSGSVEICEMLINNGAEANPEKNGVVLRLAAQNGHTEACGLFIEKGVDVDARDDDGETALMRAAFYDHTKTCAFLIRKGADINAKSRDGKTAPMIAEHSRDSKTAGFLRFFSALGAETLKEFLSGFDPCVSGGG